MAVGLRAQGHHVQVWEYDERPFGFQADRTFPSDKGPAAYVDAFRDALVEDFDVVHFHFARSLIPARGALPWYWDLPVWRALGKTVVFTFHGSDVRLRSHHEADDEWSYFRFSDVPCDEERIAAQLAVIKSYAQHMTVGSVLDRPYVPEAVYLPRSVDTEQLPMVGPSRRPLPVVLHAPSRRSTKGTEFVLQVFGQMQERGIAFDVDLVEGVPHSELVRRYAEVDIIVDQLLTGEIGVASLEAMALGKVAVARVRPEVLEHHPDLPVVSADPLTLRDTLEELVRSPGLRAELGERGREFVVANHDCRLTGRRLADLYQARPRSAGLTYPGWTVPAPQRRVDVWREKVQKLEASNAALRTRVETLNRRVADLQERVSQRSAQ